MRRRTTKFLPPHDAPKSRGGRPKLPRNDAGLFACIDYAGSITNLAAVVGVTTGAVSLWRRVPAIHVVSLAAALALPRHLLRPDLYDAQEQPLPRAATHTPT